MKKIILSLLMLAASAQLFAQFGIENFESWKTYTAKSLAGINIPINLAAPTGWTGSDSFIIAFGKTFNPTGIFVPQISKVAGHSGSFASKVETKFQADIGGFAGNGPIEAGILNYAINIDISTGNLTTTGGLPFTTIPSTISFWVKTNIVGDDFTDFYANLIDNSDAIEDTIATADTTFITTDTSWKKITLPFKKTTSVGAPLILRIDANTSTFDTASHIGTYFVIDDIEVNYPTGVSTYLKSSGMAQVYPNPANNQIQIDVPTANQYRFQLVSIEGKIVMDKYLTNTKNVIESASVPSGLYTYQILGVSNSIVQTNKILIQH